MSRNNISFTFHLMNNAKMFYCAITRDETKYFHFDLEPKHQKMKWNTKNAHQLKRKERSSVSLSVCLCVQPFDFFDL